MKVSLTSPKMTTFWIIFGIIQLISFAVALAVYFRLYRYIRRYRFDESKYTLLLGFIHLHWFTVAYFGFVILWVPISYFLIRPL